MNESYPSEPGTALVVGATGLAGRAVVEHLASLSGWKVLALSRGALAQATPGSNVIPLRGDLLDPSGLRRLLSQHSITHIFYAAVHRSTTGKRASKPMNPRAAAVGMRVTGFLAPTLLKLPGFASSYYQGLAKAGEVHDPERHNLRMLRNLIEVTSQSPHRLRHVALVTGGRYNGVHMGPHLYPGWRVPLREDDPRHPGPNWYYEVEDYLGGTTELSWSWSVLRPSFLIGFAPRAPWSFGSSLAVYASLLKAQGRPLLFTGSKRAYHALWHVTCAPELARMLLWTANEPRCAGQAFNAVHGATFRWSELWPRLADYFGMQPAIAEHPVSVEKMMADQAPLWNELVLEHGLQPHGLDELLQARFLDQAMLIDWDTPYAMDKAQAFGYTSTMQPETIFTDLFERMRTQGIIPSR